MNLSMDGLNYCKQLLIQRKINDYIYTIKTENNSDSIDDNNT